MKHDYLERILTARVYDVAIETPLEIAPNLSRRIGNTIMLKREDMQPVFSFKLRGAYNKLALMTPEQLARGVVCASAGNHAQGIAMAAQTLGVKATIVMPVTTPRIKVDAVASRGGNVVLHGDSFDDAYHHAMEIVAREGATFAHPFDDPDVIAGQGTIGMEILRQHSKPIEAIFVPIGGGGIAAGIAAYVKRLRPEIKVIGVEPVDSDAMYQSLQAGERVQLASVGLFADGVAVKLVGAETFRLCQLYLDEIVRVTTDEMCAAIKDVFEDTRSILEAAGALAIAGAKAYAAREGISGKTLVAIASGANMNFERLRHIAERAEVGEQREVLLAVNIPEQPGSFKALCNFLGGRFVTEFNYRFADARLAHVFVGLQVSHRSEASVIISELSRHGLNAVDLTENELAKVHIRHQVGGRAPLAVNERLLRFEFPERPGALLNFLNSMNHEWNISLFHYRHHGADYGRVLVGIQVPDQDSDEFRRFLDQLGYVWVDESENPAYKLFLG